MAAALAYYTLFSLFPLLLLLLALIGYLLDAGWYVAIDTREYLIQLTSDVLPAAGDLVNSAIGSIQTARGASGLIGVLGLLWSASNTFNHLHIAMDEIWGINGIPAFRLTVKRRVVSIIIVLGLGLMLLVAQALKSVTYWLTTLTDQVPGGAFAHGAVTWLFPFIVAIVVFGVMYRTFPSIPISWQDVWPGAVLAGVGWELLKWLFVLYAAGFANWQAIYGPIAGVIGLLTWLYLSFMVVLFGAEFAAAYSVRLHDRPAEEPVLADGAQPDAAVPESLQTDPSPKKGRRKWGPGLVSGTAAGVIGALAALGIGLGLLVGGVRRQRKSTAE